jgi:hypothetical protein
MQSVAERAVAPKTQKAGTSQVPASHILSLNSSKQEDSDPPGKSQQSASSRSTLTIPDGPAVKMLRMAALSFSYSDHADAQRFYESIMLARSAWLASHNKRLPDPDWLDRQRYGTKRKEAV